MQEKIFLNFIKKNLWIISLFIGFAGALIVILLMPQKGYIDNIFQPICKIAIFLFIIVGIAFFPDKWGKNYLLIYLVIISFLIFFIPKLSFWGFRGIPQNLPNAYDKYYIYLFLFLFPAILLSICFSYKIGGGLPGRCIKMALFGVLILFSGFYDLMWFVINGVPFPETLPYCHHVKIFIGHYPSPLETFIFFLFHLPFIIGVLFLPLDKWIKKLNLTD